MRAERIMLRLIRPSDAEAVYSYRSRSEVARYQYWKPFTRQQSEDFTRQCSGTDLSLRGEWIGLAVVLNENGRLIGDCALLIEGLSAEIGCNISPDYQRQGYGVETLCLLIRYLFENTEAITASSLVDHRNTASIGLMLSAGMERDPDFEERTRCKGEWCTEHRYILHKKVTK